MDSRSLRRGEDKKIRKIRLPRKNPTGNRQFPGLPIFGTALGIFLMAIQIPELCAQPAGEPASVMDRIREIARQQNDGANPGWFNRLDVNRDNYVSRGEVEMAIAKTFSALDTNKDRVLDVTEYARLRAPAGTTKLAFETLDTNGDRMLSLAEFAAPTHWRFSRLDRDGDGRISRQDAAQYLNTPTSRVLPPLSGICFDIDGRLVVVSPETAENLLREGRSLSDCAWRPGSN